MSPPSQVLSLRYFATKYPTALDCSMGSQDQFALCQVWSIAWHTLSAPCQVFQLFLRWCNMVSNHCLPFASKGESWAEESNLTPLCRVKDEICGTENTTVPSTFYAVGELNILCASKITAAPWIKTWDSQMSVALCKLDYLHPSVHNYYGSASSIKFHRWLAGWLAGPAAGNPMTGTWE